MEDSWMSIITFFAGVLITVIGALLRERRQWIKHRFRSRSEETAQLMRDLKQIEKRLHEEIRQLRTEQGTVWKDMGGKVSRNEIDELRGEMNDGFKRMRRVLRQMFKPIRAQLSDLYRMLIRESSTLEARDMKAPIPRVDDEIKLVEEDLDGGAKEDEDEGGAFGEGEGGSSDAASQRPDDA